MMIEVNYVSVLISGVAMMILGYLWYGPVFGKPWMKLSGLNKSEMNGMKGGDMARLYGMMFISTLVLSYVLAHVLGAFQANDVAMALTGAFWVWVGFIATTMLGGVLWNKKPWMLYVIESGYYLVGLSIISIILTMWK